MVELRNFGFNAITISFIVTTLTGILGAYGLGIQAKKIWTSKSGESVSVSTFGFSIALYSTFWFYGLEINSLGLILQMFCRVPFLLVIMLGLLLYKGFSKTEWLLMIAVVLTIASMFYTTAISKYFLVLNLMTVVFASMQPIEIWRNKSRGKVTLFWILVYALSVFFWTIYGIVLEEWEIWAPCSILTIVFTSTVVLWILYPEQKQPTTESLPA